MSAYISKSLYDEMFISNLKTEVRLRKALRALIIQDSKRRNRDLSETDIELVTNYILDGDLWDD